ncbi:GNAT family N-acetyltransferase [Dactylosporangium sp. NPDC000521]|uniref:GNAT family N-acetyltransferase n=1 Tax=Dactylosporangium sp. NPDC000521 TaxID=3363975 RepID=UPI00368EF8E7
MDIEVVDDPQQHRFELRVDGAHAGAAYYRLHPGEIVFTHTEVDQAYEGQGLGSKLAAGALQQTRERGLRVVPQCPFIAAYLKRHPELS